MFGSPLLPDVVGVNDPVIIMRTQPPAELAAAAFFGWSADKGG
jgi:hypothetical protein